MKGEKRDKLKILLVEDNEGQAQVIQNLFPRLNPKWEVTRVVSGEETKGYLSERETDAVLLDATLPDCDGLDLLAWIREQASEVPTLMISADCRPDFVRRALESGADDVVFKDHDYLERLPPALERALERRTLYLEVKRLRNRLVELKSALEENWRLGEFAHRLRTSLTVIRSYLEMLPRNVNDPQYLDADRLESIEEVERIEALVSRLVSSFGPTESEREQVDLACAVTSAVERLKSFAEKHSVIVKTSLPSEPIFVVGDRDRLAEAVVNLLQNAIEASPRHGVVSVLLECEGKEARIRVTDPGPGVDRESIDRMFDPFFTTKPKGVGIGLAAVRRTALDHHGRLELSNPGPGGTVFDMTIPAIEGQPCSE